MACKNYLDSTYNEPMNRIRHEIEDSHIWISVEKMTYDLGQYIVNLAVGKLNPDVPLKMFYKRTRA